MSFNPIALMVYIGAYIFSIGTIEALRWLGIWDEVVPSMEVNLGVIIGLTFGWFIGRVFQKEREWEKRR